MPKPWIDFTALRHRARFEPVLDHYGLEAQGRGPQKTLLCPFHEETEPSCKVNLDKRAFHCFGCGAKGNILDFVTKMENAELPEAARQLVDICAIPLTEVSKAQDGTKSTRTNPSRPHRSPRSRENTLQLGKPAPAAQTPLCEPPGAPQVIVDPTSKPARFSYGGHPLTPPVAQRPHEDEAEGPLNPPLTFRLKLDPTHPYLAERGVSPETIEAFGLGFCARGMMKGRICIPIRNEQGELVAYAGRWPGDAGWPSGEDKYKLPPGFRKSLVLFNLNGLPFDALGEVAGGHLILVEGFFSVFRFHAIGVPAVALMGCSVSDEQIELLARHAGAVTVLMDGDAAGRAARVDIVPRLAEHLAVRAPLLLEGTSPDTLDNDALLRVTDPYPHR